MKIACIGTGFVGVVTSAVMAKLGNQVVGLDIDEAKISQLKKGIVPFFEPGLSELLLQTQASGHLSFTTNYEDGVKDAQVIMIMVGTPSAPDGQADLKYVFAVAESIAPHLMDQAVVVIKSTVPPGTNPKVQKIIEGKTKSQFYLASVPEFLKEGTAVEDTLHPDRIILGLDSEYARDLLTKLHTPLTKNIIVMSASSAQMCKYGANSYLATRITFINQIADLCQSNQADIEDVIKGIGADSRIGPHYWYPGLGYGGSCFPKDVKEIAAYAKAIGETDSLFIKIDELNEKRIAKIMDQYEQSVGGLGGKTVAVLGLSFKKNTNDTRVAPALKVIPYLLAHDATVRASDPQAIEAIRPLLPDNVSYFDDPYLACQGAHIIILLVEWDIYTKLDLAQLSAGMASPKHFFDTRNQYDRQSVINAGLQYQGIGK